MNRDVLKKLTEEKALSPVEMLELDRSLENQAQSGLAHLTRKAQDHEPSLAWRSSLNEKLAALAPAPRKAPWWVPVLRWGAPVAAAVALGAFFIMRPSSPFMKPPVQPVVETAQGKDVENTLVLIHRVSVSAEDAGLVIPVESAAGYEWSTLEAF